MLIQNPLGIRQEGPEGNQVWVRDTWSLEFLTNVSRVKAQGRGVGWGKGGRASRELSGGEMREWKKHALFIAVSQTLPGQLADRKCHDPISTCVKVSARWLTNFATIWKITRNVLILKILLARLVKSQQLDVIAGGKKSPSHIMTFSPSPRKL